MVFIVFDMFVCACSTHAHIFYDLQNWTCLCDNTIVHFHECEFITFYVLRAIKNNQKRKMLSKNKKTIKKVRDSIGNRIQIFTACSQPEFFLRFSKQNSPQERLHGSYNTFQLSRIMPQFCVSWVWQKFKLQLTSQFTQYGTCSASKSLKMICKIRLYFRIVGIDFDMPSMIRF